MASGTHEAPAQPRIAIVGSGPSGCYLAQALLRAYPGAEITIFDRLPSPFGLIRYGVAADHQHTKAITRQFERLFMAPNVRFAGGVSVGTDVSLEAIRAQYDIVALATGLTHDRTLDIPGAKLPEVFGAGAITRTLNAHPNERPELPSFGADVVLVGGGNVALDVLRFLVKDRSGYVDSDVSDHALDHYLSRPAERVSVLVRSTAAEMKADAQMLRELAELPRTRYRVAGSLAAQVGVQAAVGEAQTVAQDRARDARLDALAALTSPERQPHPGPEVTFHFDTVPLEVKGVTRVEAVAISTSDIPVPASAVITAIGFVRSTESIPPESAPPEPGLYRTGWAKRGARGAIPENRSCAKDVAAEIVADLARGAIAVDPVRRGFDGLPEQLAHTSVSYAQWVALDEHERRQAPKGRVRQKIADLAHMLSIARSDQGPHE